MAYRVCISFFPSRFFRAKEKQSEWEIPLVNISDKAGFVYRGMHLDVSRHFFSVEFIKQYIDLLAMYKYNNFHWHLTDDQGWRIEIKAYPQLTEVGGWRKETKSDIRERPPQTSLMARNTAVFIRRTKYAKL